MSPLFKAPTCRRSPILSEFGSPPLHIQRVLQIVHSQTHERDNATGQFFPRHGERKR
jgi:hypothetical protein